jgi:hypothetical protein
MTIFKIGDRVEWVAKGNIKQAEIVATVSVLESPHPVVARLGDRFQNMAVLPDAKPRTHLSYLVATPEGPRGGKRKLYWPRVSELTKVK